MWKTDNCNFQADTKCVSLILDVTSVNNVNTQSESYRRMVVIMQILKKVIWTAALLFSGAIGITYADIVYAEANINQNAAENNLIYNFKNTKKEGTVTFTKKWKDRKNNDDRPIPDIEISTKKPKKNINGYTVTFHGNGMTFADGSVKNEIVFNSAMDIIIGQYKIPGTMNVFWFTEPECINKVNVSKNGIPSIQLTEDIDLYARPVTFILKSGSNFNKLISDNINEIRFTDIEMPDDAIAIDVDDDGDNGIVAWNDNNIMYVSTQIEGINIIFQKYSDSMFEGKQNLKSIIFDNVDTRNVGYMQYMFRNCSSLTELNLLQFNTESVEAMSGMFRGCTSLISLNIESFNTSNVVYMPSEFQDCISLR